MVVILVAVFLRLIKLLLLNASDDTLLCKDYLLHFIGINF